MIQSYTELLGLIDRGVITALPENVNGSSIDIRLGRDILVEQQWHHWSDNAIIEMSDKSGKQWVKKEIPDEGYLLAPGAVILAHTIEVFNMPLDMSAEYKLKSTQARNCLNHALASWIDPGWTNSVLTLELHNTSQKHWIRLRAGEKVGQIIFHRHLTVPYEMSYASRGSYNNDLTVQHGRGIK